MPTLDQPQQPTEDHDDEMCATCDHRYFQKRECMNQRSPHCGKTTEENFVCEYWEVCIPF